MLALGLWWGRAPAATNGTSFAPGTLIIPMDTDTTGNHASFNQNSGMWKAYGLVFRLLQNGIPVSWAISQDKTAVTDPDASVSSVKDLRTGTALGSWDYRGGPFIVDSAYAARAEPIIRAWWTANANQPNVHVAQSDFTADVNVTLHDAPRIAEDAVNAGIAIAYFNAAGIPDANGGPWSTKSPNVLTQAQIAGGALYEAGVEGCAQRKYDIFVTPHNGGYSYSLTDPTNLGTRAYAQLDNFVHDGGGWTALCHSILSNENAIADLTRNGSAAVKSLFKTSVSGGEPGGFLTKTGFPVISNKGANGTWTVNPASAGLAIAQVAGTTAANSLPGGSVQTWPSPDQPAPANAGAPTYWPNTESVASFTQNGIKYDHVISGTYHDGTGAGKLTFIGGHQLSTSLPYSANGQAPYLRVFYNSLFFNGAAVAKLDLTASPGTFPQNGTGLLNLSITNTGGSVATNATGVGITLAPGVNYVSTTSGPEPDRIDGQHLVWDSLGDVAGDTSPVTIQVSLDSSVSGTTGVKQIASFGAQYGDVFGEKFTAGVCHDIEITPVPAPTLTKTPSTQGPVVTGAPVTWTLSYGNTGSAALQNAVLQDTLPKGFAYSASTSTPDLGRPTVIPAPSGTILRWTVPGTIDAGTPDAGTVTITARAGAVTTGSGTPPQQTFTNNATLTGTDPAGNPFSASASADVVVKALEIGLDKSVSETSLTTLPGELTYTLTPRSSGNDKLTDVRVIDPYPTGLTPPPIAISAGGTYGNYVPSDAVPGDDPGPPHLTSDLTVDPTSVSQGDTVSITLHLTSNQAIASVTPSDLGISGGTAACGPPAPASTTVPNGGAGASFTWTCTLQDAGEYLFSGGAGDSTDTYTWPVAISQGVLSAATGGPSVVTWNLGSTTAAVGGATITSGTTAGVYGFQGKTDTGLPFRRYDLATGTWASKRNAPGKVDKGGSLTTDGDTTIYAFQGNSQALWSYDTVTDTWTALALTGTPNVLQGGALQYLKVGDNAYLYAVFGNGTSNFKRYDLNNPSCLTTAANAGLTAAAQTALCWTNEASVGSPGTAVTTKEGGSLTTDGTYIYLLAGNGSANKAFLRYDPATNTWTRLADTIDKVGWGGALVYAGGSLYAFRGGGNQVFWRYNLGNPSCQTTAADAGLTAAQQTALCWTVRAVPPAKVNNGGALTTDGTTIFALQGGGNKNVAFWQYTIATDSWTALTSWGTGDKVGVQDGGALVFIPPNHPEGYFTSLEASRSLVGTGDTFTVTFTISSSNPVDGVDPGTLDVTPANGAGGAKCEPLEGPVPEPPQDINDPSIPLTYVWTCHAVAGDLPDTLTFDDNTATAATTVGATPGSTVTFPLATSNSVIVTPPLTFRATVPSGAPSPIVDQGLLAANGQTVNSPPISTFVGEPRLEVTKRSSVPEGTTVHPGDPIRYTMVVENTGVTTATNVEVTDQVPAHTVYSTCSGAPCSQSAGTVTWNVGPLEPGETATVSFDVTASTNEAISTTPYPISNAASATSTETPEPSESNTVTNELSVLPSIVKSVSAAEAAPGDTLTYTLTVSNPGAAFTGDVTDPLPAGTGFAGNCTAEQATEQGVVSLPDAPDCTHDGNVTWNDVTIPPGTSIFSFDVTVTARGGATVTDTATLHPTSPSVPAIDSNPVDTAIGPELAIAKTNDPTGQVENGDKITYTLLLTNESDVDATDVVVTDPVPTGTTYDDGTPCTTPDGTTCTLRGGNVVWELPTVAAGDSVELTFTVTVGTPPGGTFQITNQATATASNTSQTTVSNVVTNALPFVDLQLTKTAAESSYDAVGDEIHYTYTVRNNSTTSPVVGPVTVRDDKVGTVTCPTGPIAPLQAITCTGTYTVTQADLNAGSITNTATARANGVDSNQAETTVPADTRPALSLTKSITANETYTTVGQKIAYRYEVTNTGNVAVDQISVQDNNVDADAQPTCDTTGPLAPQASTTCTAEHTVTQADIDAGQVTNRATASALGVTSNEATATATSDPTKSMTMTKTSNATHRTGAGDRITYRFAVTNTGTVTITSLTVTDPLVGLSRVTCNATSLGPGDSTTCTATYRVTQADVDAGVIVNTATAHGTTAAAGDVPEASSTLTIRLHRSPRVRIVKSSNATAETRVGDTITYTYVVRNTGDVTITSFTVTDNLANVSPIDCDGVTSLAPRASAVCTATYIVTQADVNAGSIRDTATVSGTTANAGSVRDSDTLQSMLTSTAALSLTKTAGEIQMAGDAPAPGDTIEYTLTATNTGNTTLTDVSISDPLLPNLSCSTGSLAPGDSLVCHGTYELTQADIDAGEVVNEATAESLQTSPTTKEAMTPVEQSPSLLLAKDGDLADVGAAPRAGEDVEYVVRATNTGNQTLTDVGVVDSELSNLVCAPEVPVARLAPGESIRCTGSRPLLQGEIDRGRVDNTATATTSTEGVAPQQADERVRLPREPGLVLDKRGVLDPSLVAPADEVNVGDLVRYRLMARNTGNTTLSNVRVSDPRLGGTLVCTPSVVSGATLLPGEQVVCTGRYALTQADIDAEEVLNTATATSRQTRRPARVQDRVPVPAAPALELSKTAAPLTRTPPHAGDTVSYTITATNTGNQTLTDVNVVDHTPLTDFSCTPSVPATTLAPGDHITCTGSHELTQDEIDAEHFDNTATATTSTEGVAPKQEQERVEWENDNALTLIKDAELDTPPGRAPAPDDTITYTLTATNTGNSTLSGVRITDSDPQLQNLDCSPVAPATSTTTLQPGQQISCTGTHTLSQADINRGSVADTASADSDQDTPATDSDETSNLDAPALSLRKTGALADTTNPPRAGDKADYTITATNSGNTTLTNLTITDTLLGGNLDCTPVAPATSTTTLQPGQQVTCTGSHALTLREIDNGRVTNTATATSTQTPRAVRASRTIRLHRARGLRLFKTGVLHTAGPAAAPGDTIEYMLTATNTGNTTLSRVRISDPTLRRLRCRQPVSLAPGDSLVCHATYTLTQDDIDNGEVVNTATATDSAGTTDTATDTTDGLASPSLLLAKDGDLADVGAAPRAGEGVDYVIRATNTGNQTLTDVGVVDSELSNLVCDPEVPVARLAPGESIRCTGSRPLLQGEIDRGHVDNRATATTTTEGVATQHADERVRLPREPRLELSKRGVLDTNGESQVGDLVRYDVVAKNTGNQTLTNVRISDPRLGGTLSCTPPVPPAVARGATLLPGDQIVCAGSYRLTQADIDAEEVLNTATATSSQTRRPARAQDRVPVPAAPALELSKTAAPLSGTPRAGERVSYTITATNTGNQTLTNVNAADQTPLRDFSCTPTLPVASLAPNASISCTGSHELTQDEIDAGEVENTASATSSQTTPEPETLKIPLEQDNALTLIKDAVLDTPPGRAPAPGDTITYTLTATNNGNTTLSGITISDPLLQQNLHCSPVAPATSTSTLLPGEQITCSGSHTLTQADINSGTVANTASANSDQDTPTTDDEQVSNLDTPALTLRKDLANPPPQTPRAGDTLTYTIAATNTGNTTLTGVRISDPTLGRLRCRQPATLAPGATLTCTGTHTLTLAEIDNGEFTNTATATSRQTRRPVRASKAVDLPHAGELTLTKQGKLASTPPTVGETITYTLTATNTGNTTLHAVSIDDPKLGDLTCDQPIDLRPGDSLVCSGTHPLSQADIYAGHVHNLATAQNGDGTTATSRHVRTQVPRNPALTLVKHAMLDTTPVKPALRRADAGDLIRYRLIATKSGNTTLSNVTVSDPLLENLVCMPLPPATSTTLLPGQQIACTGRHTLTQADIDAGHFDNTAFARSGGTSVSAPNGVGLDRVPSLSLFKRGVLDRSRPARVGDVVRYRLVATNTGNQTLTEVRISDPKLRGTLACTPPVPPAVATGPTLAPDEQIVCTGRYRLTQADIDADKVVNTATATSRETAEAGEPPTEAPSEVTDLATPELTLTKTSRNVFDVVAPDDRADPRDRIDYELTATNTGNTTLTNVRISDPTLTTFDCAQGATLAPGESLVCHGTRELTRADINAGSLANDASANSAQNTPDTTTETTDGLRAFGLGLEKTVTGALPATPAVGDLIHYMVRAGNTGNTPLTNVNVTDGLLTNLTCTPSVPVATLAPGDEITCTGSHPLTLADIDAGEVTNSAAATSNETEPAHATAPVEVKQVPGLSLTKVGTVDTTVVPPSNRADDGDRIRYTLTATNTGNTTLTGVQISDPSLGRLTCAQPATLAPGQSLVCTGSRRLTQAQIDAGSVVNTATATDSAGTRAARTATTGVPQSPSLTLVKSGALVDTSAPPRAGDKVEYRLTATNTGNTTLRSVSILDPRLGRLTCSQPVDLAPGQSLVCTATHTLTQLEIDVGRITNIATARSNRTRPTLASQTVRLPRTPSLDFAKSGTLTPAAPAVGDEIHYTLTATNTGNTTLTRVTISDDKITGRLSCTPSQPATLLPGRSLVCTGPYPLTQADIDLGRVVNTATVTSGQTSPQTASDPITVPQVRALSLDKKEIGTKLSVVPPATRWDAGDLVKYELTVSNSGNTTLTGVEVSDPKLGRLVCIAPRGQRQPATLLPGEDLECVGIHRVTQAEIDAGQILNTATARSNDSPETTEEETFGLTREPALTLVKKAIPVPTVVEPDNRLDTGDRIDYTLTATNTGNTTLTGVRISDPLLPSLTCTPPAPATPTTLLPGEQIVCTGSHPITQRDINSGRLTNTATATARSNRTRVRAGDSASVVLPRVRALSLVKRVAPPTPSPDKIHVGTVLHYEYVVTNTGNVPLTGRVSVADNRTSVSCPRGRPIAVGASITCTSSYTVTQADVDAGRVTNTATATANGRTSNPSTVNVDPVQVRSLSLVKTATPTRYDRAGETIRYSYTVTNTGNVTLAGPVTVTDDRIAHVKCPAGDLAPNESTICTATYTTTAAPSVTNVATARANGARSNQARDTVIRTGRPPAPPAPHASIEIAKTPATQQVQRGGTARFTIRVTNTGNAPLTDVTVSDPQAPGCDRTGSTTPALAVLAPGASVTYRCSLRNVQSAFTNVATATSAGPAQQRVTARSSARVTLGRPLVPPSSTALTIVKGPATQTVVRGGVATFTVTVRNTGNVTLRNVIVDDPRVPKCSRKFASLAPGQSKSYSCSVFTRAAFSNVATVTARSARGVRVRSRTRVAARVRVVARSTPSEPAILVVKEPDLQTVGRGQTAHFEVTVENVGNVTLHDVRVVDPTTLACARTIGTLAPSRRAIYGCQSPGVQSPFTNRVIARGVSPQGAPVNSIDFAVVQVRGVLAPQQVFPEFTG